MVAFAPGVDSLPLKLNAVAIGWLAGETLNAAIGASLVTVTVCVMLLVLPKPSTTVRVTL